VGNSQSSAAYAGCMLILLFFLFHILKVLSLSLNQFIMFVTKEVLKRKVPLIHKVIPFIDRLTAMLDEVIDNVLLLLTVWHAALCGVLLLHKYYAKTNNSIIYCISMSK
jgi:hypothetical protein